MPQPYEPSPSLSTPSPKKTSSVVIKFMGTENQYVSKAVLSEPLHHPEEEQCAMTLENMATYDLPFAPGCTFMEDKPHLRKLTLECGHAFSAMACIYYFCKTHMRCPLCRTGSDCMLDISTLPVHLRDSLSTHLSKQRKEDEDEQILEDEQMGREFFAQQFTVTNIRYHLQRRFFVTMYCYANFEDIAPLCSMECDIDCRSTESEITVSMPRHALRKISNDLKNIPIITAVQFAVGLRMLPTEFIFLDRTATLALQAMSAHTGRCTYHGNGTACFDIHLNHGESPSFFEWKWTIPRDNLTALVHDIPLQIMMFVQ
jgi:hypothetical protein